MYIFLMIKMIFQVESDKEVSEINTSVITKINTSVITKKKIHTLMQKLILMI